MEHLKSLGGLDALALAFTLNALVWIGKFLWKLFEKKNSAAEQNQKQTAEKVQQLSESLANIEGQIDRLMNVTSSYMETTIEFASKLGAVEKQFDHFSEKLRAFEKFMDDLR